MAGLFPTGDALGAMPDASVVQHLGLAVADEGPTPGEEPGGGATRGPSIDVEWCHGCSWSTVVGQAIHSQ